TFAVALICSLFALYEGMKVPVIKNITLFSPKITSEKKIVLMPDIHINRTISEDKLEKLIAQANAQNPDLILLLGDIVDDIPKRIESIVQKLQKLQAKYGVYAVAGNHEVYIGYKPATHLLQKNNIPVLTNEGIFVTDDLFLGGIPDTTSMRFSGLNYDLNKTFQKAAPEQYKILMSHTPTHFNAAPFDLEVSGHTHGGQIFPFYPMIYLFQRYVAGLYDMNANTKIYVSRGAGQWGPQMRLFAPSEMTVITLKPQ
ncbi:MAG: metallophosphoesterase, partial [Alphaproteobacteria bacterium]|nr:metallophosphoesterase [Alphaproteobacteria bacterium]